MVLTPENRLLNARGFFKGTLAVPVGAWLGSDGRCWEFSTIPPNSDREIRNSDGNLSAIARFLVGLRKGRCLIAYRAEDMLLRCRVSRKFQELWKKIVPQGHPPTASLPQAKRTKKMLTWEPKMQFSVYKYSYGTEKLNVP